MAGSAFAGGSFASAAYAAAGASRSVTELGVEPDSKADQTQALQKAIDELSGAGQAVVLPAGTFRAGTLALPPVCSIVGIAGHTMLHLDRAAAGSANGKTGTFNLFGIQFRQNSATAMPALLSILNATMSVSACGFSTAGKTALKLDRCSGNIEAVEISGYSDGAISATSSSLKINGCTFNDCAAGILTAMSDSVIIGQNQFRGCATGVAADGICIVSGNVIRGARGFGLRLGRAGGEGRIVAQGNLLDDCRVGIGVASSGDDIFASLNLIHGARDGAIRAFDGDRLVGRDLARESSEVYLNLTVAGNVAR
jgi:hypothetical protein